MVDELKHIIAGEDYCFNQHITIHNPTLKEIFELGEKEYFQTLQTFTIRPYDAMVFLYDIGLNHEDVDEFEFFAQHLVGFFQMLEKNKSEGEEITNGLKLLFGDLDFSDFILTRNVDNEHLCLYNEKLDFVFDKLVYKRLLSYLRRINCMPEDVEYKSIGNKITRKFIIEKMRKKMKKDSNKEFESQLSNIVSSLVNYDGFKYDYQSVFNLHISQFWDAFMRINKIMDYNFTMQGVYAGNVDYSKITDKESLNWISNLTLNK